MSNQAQATTSPAFPQFSKFVPEIKDLIWFFTLPPPRALEAALFDNPDADDEIVNLRPTSTITTLLSLPDLVRITEDRPLEACPDPVALQINQASREVALRHYRVMPALGLHGNFYYNPKQDVVFLSVDATDDYESHVPSLEQWHGNELNRIENVMLLAERWPENAGPRETDTCLMRFLRSFGGLKKVILVWRGEEDENASEDESMDGVEVAVEGDPMSEDEEEVEEVLKGVRAVAKSVRENFKAVVRAGKCTATSVEILDWDGDVY